MLPKEAEEAIALYRSDHPMTVRFWYSVHNSLKAAIRQPGRAFGYRGVKVKVVSDRNKTNWLVLTLPSGRNLFYCDPKMRPNIFGNPGPSYLGYKDYQWKRIDISPGHITENIIQALGADILFNGKNKLFEYGFKVCLSVHDEFLIELFKRDATPEIFEKIRSCVCHLPPWAIGLPLDAEGEFSEGYKKI
jgi:DNA polymerase